jgi:hypothetical protein
MPPGAPRAHKPRDVSVRADAGAPAGLLVVIRTIDEGVVPVSGGLALPGAASHVSPSRSFNSGRVVETDTGNRFSEKSLNR